MTFLATVTPVDFVAACTLDVYNETFTVDWGDGSPIAYTSGNPTTVSVVPTGNITITGTGTNTLNRIRFVTDTFSAININDGSSLTGAFRMCSSKTALTSFLATGLGGVTTFEQAWFQCSGLTSFPLIDISSATTLSSAWNQCSGLTSFPLIVITTNVTLAGAWIECSSLTAFPGINTSLVTNLNSTWTQCSGLTSFPLIDTSSVTIMNQTWSLCSGLTSFPLIDTSSVLNLSGAWTSCGGLTSFPLIDTSSVTDLSSTWRNCSNLLTFPAINTSSAITLSQTWSTCGGLTSFPLIDTTLVTNFSQTWLSCSGLLSMPQINTIAGTDFTNTFNGCTSLKCLSSLDTRVSTDGANIFSNTPALVAPDSTEQTALAGAPGILYTNPGACPLPIATLVANAAYVSVASEYSASAIASLVANAAYVSRASEYSASSVATSNQANAAYVSLPSNYKVFGSVLHKGGTSGSTLFTQHTKEEHADSLANYNPGGRLFEGGRTGGSNIRKLLLGLACELFTAEGYLKTIATEYDIHTTTLLIEEWEAALGIPDSCFTGEGTIQQRRQGVLIKLAASGVQTSEDFVELAALFGVTVEVLPGEPHSNIFPFTFPVTFFPDAKTARFTIIIIFKDQVVSRFPLTFPITFGNAAIGFLECVFAKLRPANCALKFIQV